MSLNPELLMAVIEANAKFMSVLRLRSFVILVCLNLANPAFGLAPGTYFSSTAPERFVEITEFIVTSDEIQYIHGEDFGVPSKRAYGLLAWYSAYMSSTDSAVQTCRRLFKEFPAIAQSRNLATTSNKKNLVFDITYLMFAARDNPNTDIDTLMNLAFERASRLGYDNVLVIERCQTSGDHPGYRVHRELHRSDSGVFDTTKINKRKIKDVVSR